MSTETIIEQSTTTEALSPFRTRWGSEFSAHEGNPDFVLSLARGLRVIEYLEGHPDGLTIAEISRHTALSRAAVRRLLITLQLLGYIEAEVRKYRLRHGGLRRQA
jgi:IclR family transcriptional regulator, pca regulon regulatory protein